MPGKKHYPVIFIAFLFCFLLRDLPAFAQTQPFLDKRVSFTFSATPLSTVLLAIGNKTGVKFSYNPELIQPGRRITMRFNNLPLREVLKQLLNDPTIAYREIGNQIVIYRGDPSQFPLEPNQQLVEGKPQIVLPAKRSPDTVYVYQLDTLIINRIDTIFRMITLTRYDTVRLTDTVFIKKGRSSQKKVNNQNDSLETGSGKHKKFPENDGFCSGLYFELLSGSATYLNATPESREYKDLMEQANSGNSFKFSAGIMSAYEYQRVGIRSGVGYSMLSEDFNYSFSVNTGGFYRTDTVEKYYTLSGIDTSWYYITDSTWVPESLKDYVYQNSNSYSYIDIPLSLKFRFWQNHSAEIYALGGIKASFLVSVNALIINPDNYNEVIRTSKSDLNPVLFAWHAGMGTAIKFNSRTGIIAEATYNKQTKSQYKDLPLDKRYGLIGIKLGAYLRF